MVYDSLEELCRRVLTWHDLGLRVVLCHGCFDPLHAGHIDYFTKSKLEGDILVVSVTADKYVRQQKGSHKPLFDITKRMSDIDYISIVDVVIESDNDTCKELLRMLQPDVYCKGKDSGIFSDRLDEERAIIEAYGGRIVYQDRLGITSTQLIPQKSLPFQNYISNLDSCLYDNIMKCLELISDMKVLIIGETIIDRYTYVNVMDKAPKTGILGCKVVSSETMSGASVFITKILSKFVKEVMLISDIGRNTSGLDFDPMHFVLNNSDDNIRYRYMQTDKPTIIKHRYLEKDFTELEHREVLFEACHLDDSPMSNEAEDVLRNMIANEVLTGGYDMVLVSDFGHGFISQAMADWISGFNIYKSIGTQVNESNQGFNFLDKYKGFDYASISGVELRLQERDAYGDIPSLIYKVLARNMIRDSCFSVTAGPQGAYVADNEDIVTVPPVSSDHVLDRIGAGDAFFALSALFARVTSDKNIIGIAGNTAGALKVQNVCTSLPIEKEAFIRKVKEILDKE
jgi:rfaE bifunctional protein nucleotidyltransferase chain/domain